MSGNARKASAVFPEGQEKLGKSSSGKLYHEKGFTQTPFELGSGNITRENAREGLPMKDTAHPHTGDNILGET